MTDLQQPLRARPRPGDPGDARRAVTPLHRAARVAFGLYLVVLAGAAFLPLPVGMPPRGSGVAYELTLHRPDLLGGWEAQRNVLMTVPFGLLLPLVVRWRYEALLLACVAVTVVVETGQLAVSALVGWPWRAFDVNDLLLNTVGGLLGLAVTGAALAVVRRPVPPRPWRLVPGALAAALVGWAVVSTVTTPAATVPVYACDEPPAHAVTALPAGATAYAGPDGSVCVLVDDGTSSLPLDAGPRPALVLVRSDVTWEYGLVRPGEDPAPDAADATVELYPVEGTTARVWVARG
ncbi:VanZ family protein [Cellulomonas sp. 179-A 9B4 NHS]|uniref:VanZ family protein n=1 Tax=Cellulomonas sp. 179-A 9B4 NHS TaxID=3142379 RepID=UPI00399FEF47